MHSSKISANIGFKEWEVVCAALASGQQQLIFRKGGIHEGREGFSFKHETFALFPTRFHEQSQYVTVECPTTPKPDWEVGDEVSITHIAMAEWAKTLVDWQDVTALKNHHIYSEQTLSDRFHWESESMKGMASGSIHVALVRVYKLAAPIQFLYGKKYAGCRSWIEIPAFDASQLEPVISDEAFGKIKSQLG